MCVSLDGSVSDVITWQCAIRHYGGEKRWREEGWAKKWKNKRDGGDDRSHGEREMSQVESRCRGFCCCHQVSSGELALQPCSSVLTSVRTRPETPELHLCSHQSHREAGDGQSAGLSPETSLIIPSPSVVQLRPQDPVTAVGSLRTSAVCLI